MGCVLSFFGWAAPGVMARSFAARIQSLIGNVVRGSLFALLQHLGATGAGFFTILAKLAGWAFGFGIGAVVIASTLFGLFRL